MSQADHAYYMHRADQEQANAEHAATPEARLAHQMLHDLYLGRLGRPGEKNPPLRPTSMNGLSRSFGSQRSDPFVTRLQRLTQLGQEEIGDLQHRNDGALQAQGSHQAGLDARG